MDKVNSKQVLELMGELADDERYLLLNSYKLTDIVAMISDKEFLDMVICNFHSLGDALENLACIGDGGQAKSKAEKLYDAYASLDEESKKELSVLLYNDQKFQGYLTQILIGIIKKEMPEMLTLFKALGIDLEKYMLDAIRLGKGYKRYIVE